MTVQGTVVNGVIVLEKGTTLPEGLRVEVIVKEPSDADSASLRNLLLEFSGTCPGLPADMAAQHDHYIHGTPKR